jgi:SPOR domain
VAQPIHQYDEYEERDGDFELVGEQRDELPARGRSRLLTVALTLGVMLLFAGGLWFAYMQGTRHAGGGGAQTAEAVPVLRADDRPTKIRPEQPGGMPMPDQNSSLYNEKLAKSPVEKLLPPPEQPLPRPAPAPITPVRPTAAPQIQMPPAETSPAETAAATAAGPRVRAPQTAAAAMPPAEAGPGAATAQTAAPKPVQKAALPAEPAAGMVQVRLGSLRTPEEAREEWQRLKRENAELLGKLKANAVSVDLGEKGIYYRIQAGPLDEAAAERVCTELKGRNHGCIIAR